MKCKTSKFDAIEIVVQVVNTMYISMWNVKILKFGVIGSVGSVIDVMSELR